MKPSWCLNERKWVLETKISQGFYEFSLRKCVHNNLYPVKYYPKPFLASEIYEVKHQGVHIANFNDLAVTMPLSLALYLYYETLLFITKMFILEELKFIILGLMFNTTLLDLFTPSELKKKKR